MRVPPIVFDDWALRYVNSNITYAARNRGPLPEKTFRAHFHISSQGCSDLWLRLTLGIGPLKEFNNVAFEEIKENHLLWTLHYLHIAPSNEVASTFFGTSQKTYRKYNWALLRFLHYLSTKMVRTSSMLTCNHLLIMTLVLLNLR